MLSFVNYLENYVPTGALKMVFALEVFVIVYLVIMEKIVVLLLVL